MLVRLSLLGFLPCFSAHSADILTAAKAAAGGSQSLTGEVATNNGSPLNVIPWEGLAGNCEESASCIPANSVSIGQTWAEHRSFQITKTPAPHVAKISLNESKEKRWAHCRRVPKIPPACGCITCHPLQCPWQCSLGEMKRCLSKCPSVTQRAAALLAALR